MLSQVFKGPSFVLQNKRMKGLEAHGNIHRYYFRPICSLLICCLLKRLCSSLFHFRLRTVFIFMNKAPSEGTVLQGCGPIISEIVGLWYKWKVL